MEACGRKFIVGEGQRNSGHRATPSWMRLDGFLSGHVPIVLGFGDRSGPTQAVSLPGFHCADARFLSRVSVSMSLKTPSYPIRMILDFAELARKLQLTGRAVPLPGFLRARVGA